MRRAAVFWRRRWWWTGRIRRTWRRRRKLSVNRLQRIDCWKTPRRSWRVPPTSTSISHCRYTADGAPPRYAADRTPRRLRPGDVGGHQRRAGLMPVVHRRWTDSSPYTTPPYHQTSSPAAFQTRSPRPVSRHANPLTPTVAIWVQL